jgi:hypothetical protein
MHIMCEEKLPKVVKTRKKGEMVGKESGEGEQLGETRNGDRISDEINYLSSPKTLETPLYTSLSPTVTY